MCFRDLAAPNYEGWPQTGVVCHCDTLDRSGFVRYAKLRHIHGLGTAPLSSAKTKIGQRETSVPDALGKLALSDSLVYGLLFRETTAGFCGLLFCLSRCGASTGLRPFNVAFSSLSCFQGREIAAITRGWEVGPRATWNNDETRRGRVANVCSIFPAP